MLQYEQTLCIFYKSLDKVAKSRLLAKDLEQLEKLVKEESSKTVYRSTREELKGRLQPVGILIYKLLKLFTELQTESFQLLHRVFNEQYKISQDKQIKLRPKEEISSSSLQSPHDPASAYRNKGGQKVKGCSVNITETCSKDNINLIINVIIEKANTPDTAFVEPAIKATIFQLGFPLRNNKSKYRELSNKKHGLSVDVCGSILSEYLTLRNKYVKELLKQW